LINTVESDGPGVVGHFPITAAGSDGRRDTL